MCAIPRAYQEYINKNPGMHVVPYQPGRRIDICKADISREYPWTDKGYEVPPWDLNNQQNRKRLNLKP